MTGQLIEQTDRDKDIIRLLTEGVPVVKMANALGMSVQEAPAAVQQALDSIELGDLMNYIKINFLRFKELSDKMRSDLMDGSEMDPKKVDSYRQVLKDFNSEISNTLKVQNDIKKTMIEQQRKDMLQYLQAAFMRSLELADVDKTTRVKVAQKFIELMEGSVRKNG